MENKFVNYRYYGIYKNNLEYINNIKFTFREIDVLSSLLYNEREKRIANILSIASKTINTHKRNIMQKLAVNSRVEVVIFIKKSDKLNLLIRYYCQILIDNYFESYLEKTLRHLSKQQKFCYVQYNDNSDIEKKYATILKHALSLVNVKILNKNDFEAENNAHVVSFSTIHCSKKKSIGSVLSINLINKDTSKEVKFFDSKDNYTLILKIIYLILDNNQNQKIITKFEDECTNIKNSYSTYYTNAKKPQLSYITNLKTLSKKKHIFLFFLVSFVLSYIGNKLFYNKIDLQIYNKQQDNNNLRDFLHIIKENQIHKNHDIVKKIEPILFKSNNMSVNLAYFLNNQLSSKELVNYLYNLHALSNYYTYHEHDGFKARKILQHTKEFIEHYVISKSKVSFEFNSLSLDELYTELSLIKDLPEMYTKIIFLLGKTYIYQGNREDGMKYFDISKYLGNRLKIFEGYLSEVSGIGIINKTKINSYIENKEYAKAIDQIHESIKLYKRLKINNNEYKADYNPSLEHQKIIIPLHNTYNQVICDKQLAWHYIKLLMISEDSNKKFNYARHTLNLFLDDNKSSGILLSLDKLPKKKIASVYNSLGNILLQLEKENIDLKSFYEDISNILNLKNSNKANMIEQIFKLAQSYSRYTDYTKADSYEGLIKVYTNQLNQKSLSKSQEKQLQQKILKCLQEKNRINKILNRNYTQDLIKASS